MPEKTNGKIVHETEDEFLPMAMSGGRSSRHTGPSVEENISPMGRSNSSARSAPRTPNSVIRAGLAKRKNRALEKDTRSDRRSPAPVLRITALIPFFLSAVAFALTILVLLSGTKSGYMEDGHLLALNTSHIGENLIEFSPATSTSASTATTAAAANGIKERFNPLDPFGILPTTLPSITLPSITLPGISLPTATSTTGGTSSGSSSTTATQGTNFVALLLTALGDIVSGQGITASVDEALNSAEASLVSGILDSFGVQEYYSLHVQNICEGNYSSTTDPDASVDITSCPTYAQAIASLQKNKIPSSLTIASTNITVPILAELSDSSNKLSYITLLSRVIFAFLIISISGSGILMLLSIAGIFFPSNRPILYTALTVSSIGSITRLTDAITITVISEAITSIVNSFGDGVGVSSMAGTKIIIFIWVSFVCAVLTDLYWLVIWFVEFREISYKVRRRTPDQIGNWKGIWQELLSDIMLDKETPPIRPRSESAMFVSKLEEGVLQQPKKRLSYHQT